jgi:hypothetical protein
MLTGRCLCEGVIYEVEGELGPAFNCHCSKCRRWHGAAFRSRASIRTEQFRWARGEELLSRFTLGKATRHFCQVCGSNLITSYADRPEVLGLPLGGLEQHPGRVPEAHIFVGSKSPWYEISDGLPQFEGWPGGEAKVRETR